MVSELFNTTAPIDLGQYFFWTLYKKINRAFEGINFTPTVPLSCVFDNQKKKYVKFSMREIQLFQRMNGTHFCLG